MASRQVVEHTCERCTRTWYVDATCKATLEKLTLTFHGDTVEYNCLCEGCTKTVSALVAQISKVMKKNAPVRGAKKKAEGGAKAPPTATAVTPTASNLPKPPGAGASEPHGLPAAAKSARPT